MLTKSYVIKYRQMPCSDHVTDLLIQVPKALLRLQSSQRGGGGPLGLSRNSDGMAHSRLSRADGPRPATE